MLPVASGLASQSNFLLAASAAPSSIAHNELVGAMFSGHSYSSTVPEDGYLATADDPSRGFSPFRTDSGTQVLFVSNPSQLGIPFGAEISPHWRNSLGLVLMRNQDIDMFGAIALHGLMQNRWSEIALRRRSKVAWQALGGCMAFTDGQISERAAANTSVSYACKTVLDKGRAMKPKWILIDEGLGNAGHPITTDLGGAKSVFLHQPGREAKVASINALAEVATILGAYIAGNDQNVGKEWGEIFAAAAPINFMGAQTAHPLYQGVTPSPKTARGTFTALQTARDEILAGERAPIFFIGYGGTGVPMVQHAVDDGHPISGIIDIKLDALKAARARYPQAPLFLNTSIYSTEQIDALREEARQHNITLVRNDIEALDKVPSELKPIILSPNGSAHPLKRELAVYIVQQTGIKLIVGTANNILEEINGSLAPIAWYLQGNEIYSGNDSSGNRGGALAVTTGKIELDDAGIDRQINREVQHAVLREIHEGFYRRIPPQLFTDRIADLRWNDFLQQGLAIGGYSDIYPIAPPSDEDLRRLLKLGKEGNLWPRVAA